MEVVFQQMVIMRGYLSLSKHVVLSVTNTSQNKHLLEDDGDGVYYFKMNLFFNANLYANLIACNFRLHSSRCNNEFSN
jgi:hypothetical protein